MKTIRIERALTLPGDLDLLIEQSVNEGYGMLSRLKENWLSGRNTFSLEGEAYFEVRRGDLLVGVGGLNRDPYSDDASEGRLRHMYVLPAERRSGVGRLLVNRAMQHARGNFEVVRLRSTKGDTGAAQFYEALGFEPIEGDQLATHRITLAAWPGG